MLRLAFDFIITWRETRTRPNAYSKIQYKLYKNTLQKRKDATKAPFLIAHL